MKTHFLLVALALLSASAFAEVNPKNGNYFTTYQDITQKAADGSELNLRRTYNSRSHGHPGWFGWGWSSPYETRLHAMPDGTVVVRESGAGMTQFYDPQGVAARHEEGLDAIVAAATVRGQLSADQARALRAQLHADEQKRVLMAMELGVTRQAAPPERWKSRRCGSLERVDAGWVRDDCVGGRDHFTPTGALRRREEVDGDVDLVWAGERLQMVRGKGGLSLKYEWSAEGRVTAVTGSSGMQVRYTYSPAGELLRAEGPPIPGGHIDFQYDARRRLTRIAYIDTTTRQIEYDADGLTVATTERTGARTTYVYGGADASYWTRVQAHTPGGAAEPAREYRYEIAPSATGVHAVELMKIREGEDELTLGPAGQILKVVRAGKVVEEREYEEGGSRLRRLRTEAGDYAYAYDGRGRLLRAERGSAAAVEFTYDGERIGWLRETDRTTDEAHEVRFLYTAGLQATTIVVKGHPPIAITYAADGSIADVRSDGGLAVAAKLAGILQRVRALVRPAGARLPL